MTIHKGFRPDAFSPGYTSLVLPLSILDACQKARNTTAMQGYIQSSGTEPRYSILHEAELYIFVQQQETYIAQILFICFETCTRKSLAKELQADAQMRIVHTSLLVPLVLGSAINGTGNYMSFAIGSTG
jgi:hypothetical protein